MCRKFIVMLAMLLFSSTLLAQQSLITFHLKKQATLFWFHNKSNQAVLLNRVMKSDPGVQAGWASAIDPGRWSIISLSQMNARGKKTITFNCSSWSDGEGPVKPLDCAKVISSGEVVGTRLPEAFQSGFWFAENKSLLGLRKQFQYWKVPYPYLYFLYLRIRTL